jgi:hypothetical protein
MSPATVLGLTGEVMGKWIALAAAAVLLAGCDEAQDHFRIYDTRSGVFLVNSQNGEAWLFYRTDTGVQEWSPVSRHVSAEIPK